MSRLLASVAVLLAAALPAFVADPPAEKPKRKPHPDPAWTFQIRSQADLFAALRPVTAAMHGGTPDALDTWVEETFGVAGLKGLDPNRPIVGTVRPGPTADDGAVVHLAFPVTAEADFLDLLDRADAEPQPLKSHPGVTEFFWNGDACHLRFAGGYAHVVVNGTADALDPKALPAPAALSNPTAPGVASITLHPARLDDTLAHALDLWPVRVRSFLSDGYSELIPAEARGAVGQLGQMATEGELTRLLEQGERATLRFIPAADGQGLGVELAVVPKKDTPLAKQAAAPTAAANAFAALRDTPDVVEVLLARWPDFGPKVADGLEDIKKSGMPVWIEAAAELVPVLDAVTTAIADGTPKGVDVVRLTVGPDKDETYTTLYAVTVPDTRPLAKAALAMLKDPPAALGSVDDLAKAVSEPAAKAGDTPVYRLPAAGFLDAEMRAKYGKDAPAAFACGKGVVAFAVGPDAVSLVKRAVEASARPGACERVEVRANPKRADEFTARGSPYAGPHYFQYGNGEEAVREVLTVAVTTGDGELRVRADIRHDWLKRHNTYGQLGSLLDLLGWPW